MADSLFVKKLNELIEAGAKTAAPATAAAIKEVDSLGKTNAPPKPSGLPPFPVPPASAKLLKPEELKYLNAVPVDKRPVLPVVAGAPNFDDKAFQTGYKTLLFDYRDQEAKRKKEEAFRAAQAAAPTP